tara:strand:- start:131 stop:997 length:867 start_codon:yes stop_codon:yes gene_type:complete
MNKIVEINQDQFVDQVIEKSKTIPVIVDFWAPWCGPCKQLTPILEKLVNQKNGKVILAKINVDENQSLAGQLNIQSIPTVYGFVDGKPVDAFQGAQPESKIDTMIMKLIDATPGNEIPKLLEEADKNFKEQNFEESKKNYESLIGMDPGNVKIIVGLLRCYVQLKEYDQANEIISSIDDQTLANEDIVKIKKLLDGIENDEGSNIEDLKIKLRENPNDKQTRFELAEKYLNTNEIDAGFSELLYIFDEDPKWNEESPKKKLLEYFDLLGFSDPNVIKARKKLSTLMFK